MCVVEYEPVRINIDASWGQTKSIIPPLRVFGSGSSLDSILLNREPIKPCTQISRTGDLPDWHHVVNSLLYAFFFLSFLGFGIFYPKVKRKLSLERHLTASTRWFLKAQCVIITRCYSNPVNLCLRHVPADPCACVRLDCSGSRINNEKQILSVNVMAITIK